MAKLTLSDVVVNNSETTKVNTINANSALIEGAFENTLSRDGTTPNEMESDLDMNGNQILNVPAPVNPGDLVRLSELNEHIDDIEASLANAQAQAAIATAQANLATAVANSLIVDTSEAENSAIAAAASASSAAASANDAANSAASALSDAAEAVDEAIGSVSTKTSIGLSIALSTNSSWI